MILNTILDTTSLIIVSIFLLVTLVVGLYAGRNIKDFKDYVLGGRRFTTTTLVLTLFATYIGGNATFGTVKEVYSFGIIVIFVYLGYIIQHLIFAFLISSKITKFKDCYTLGDIMNQLYGVKHQLITGIFTFIFVLFTLTVNIFALGKILNYFLGIDLIFGIILSGSILGLYSSLGGIKSVTLTDIIQFLVIIIAIPLIAALVLKKVGNYDILFANIPKDKFEIFKNKKFYFYLAYFLTANIFPEKLLNPGIMQRVFMSKNRIQIRNTFITTSILDLIFRLVILIIGFSTIILFPNCNSNNVFYNLITYLFQNSSILKGIIVSGILAIIMSTADSYLHAGGVVLSHDILKFFYKNSNNKFNELFNARICTMFLSILTIVCAIKVGQGYNLRNIGFWKFGIPAPIILFPLLAGIIGIMPNKKTFIFASLAGLTSLFISMNFLPMDLKKLAVFNGILSNAAVYMIVHLIQNKGIAIINRDYDQNKPQRIWKPTWQGFLETLFSYIPTPHKIFEFSRKSVSRCGANNMLFGIFVCINFIVPYFMWDHKNEDLYNLMIYLRFFGGLLGGLLIVKTEWKDFLKPYFPLFWHFTLLYCLPFISTVMFLLTNGSIIWLLNIGTSIFFLIILTENIVFLTLTPIGIVLGILFYILRVGPVDLSSFGFEVNYQLIYQVVFSSTIGLLFSYRKKIFNSIKGNEGTNLGLAMCHELRNTGLYIYPAAQISLMYLKKYRNNFKEINGEKSYILKEKDFEYINEQNQEIERLGRLQKNIVGTFEKLLKEYRDSINDPQNFSMKHIVNQAIDQYIFKPGQKEKLDINLNKDFIAKIPKQVFIFVVDNIIRNSYKHGNPSKIKIWLEENELHIKDNGKGISEREMDLIFKMYFTNGDSSSSGIGLAFAKQIVEGFGGEIWVESQTGSSSYTEFIIKFPKVSEELSEEEIKENMELEIKKNIAESLKKDGIEESVIVKATGIARDDLQDDE